MVRLMCAAVAYFFLASVVAGEEVEGGRTCVDDGSGSCAADLPADPNPPKPGSLNDQPGSLNEQLVIMEGIDARPELNGELGIATNFNEGNGRYDVRIISLDKSATKSLSVTLKSGNLAEWGTFETTAVESLVQDDKLTPAGLIALFKQGYSVSNDADIVKKTAKRVMSFMNDDAATQALIDGGVIEMLVHSLPHSRTLEDRGVCLVLLDTIGNLVQKGDRSGKGRAVRVHFLERFNEIVDAHHRNEDIVCQAMTSFTQLVSGELGKKGKGIRKAVIESGALEMIIDSMKRWRERSAIQHVGMNALGQFLANYASNGETQPGASKAADLVIKEGGHKAMIDAMLKHGHIGNKHELHSEEQTDDGRTVKKVLPLELFGSVFLAGTRALIYLLTFGKKDKDQPKRLEAVRSAGAFKAAAAAVPEAQPMLNFVDEKNPATMLPNMLTQLIRELLEEMSPNDDEVKELLDKDQFRILIGTRTNPGFILKAQQVLGRSQSGRSERTL